MAKTLNPYWKKRMIIIAIILVAFLIWLCGCNVEKRAIRKQDKAYGITVSTPRTFSQAGALWLQIHPCVVLTKDSIVTKHDTLTTEKKVFIPFQVTQYKTKTLDTIIDGISIYIDSLGLIVKNLNEKEVTTRTIYQTKIDQTRVDNITDTLYQWKQKYSFKEGQLQAVSDNSKSKDKTIEKLWFWIILLSVAGVLSHVLRSYLPKIKIPFIKS